MRTVMFGGEKGGIGKTQTSLSTAYKLAARGKKVLVIDLDPPGNATKALSHDTVFRQETIYEALAFPKDVKLKDCIRKGEGDWKKISFVPSNRLLIDFESELVKDIAYVARLKFMLDDVKKDFDYCIIDTSPNFSSYTKMAIFASEKIFSPVDLGDWSNDGTELIEELSRIIENQMKAFDKSYKAPSFYTFISLLQDEKLATTKHMIAEYHEKFSKYDIGATIPYASQVKADLKTPCYQKLSKNHRYLKSIDKLTKNIMKG